MFRARPVIAPNLEFWRQMIEWETEHNDGKTAINLVKVEGMKGLVPDVYQSSHLVTYYYYPAETFNENLKSRTH